MNPGYRLLLETLRDLSAEAQTGVVHLYTVENQYGRFALSAGEVTHIALHNLRGLTALPALIAAAISSHRFEPNAELPLLDDLLDTPDLLAMMGAGELKPAGPRHISAAPVIASGGASVAVPIAMSPSPRPAAPTTGLTSDQLRLIEDELQHELGPMAGALVQECMPRARNAAQLIEMLADQLNPETGEKFLTRVSERLLHPSVSNPI